MNPSMNKVSFSALHGLTVLSLCLALGLARAQDAQAAHRMPIRRTAPLA